MPNLESGTVVKTDHACGDCGKPVKVKLNKNGNAYYFCPWTNPDGEPCRHQTRWGRVSSQKMQRDYLEARKIPADKIPADKIDPKPPVKKQDQGADWYENI
jgi:hypothetical protein